MSLSRIRSRIEALEHKLALALGVVKLRPMAEEFCEEWHVASGERKPLPQARPLIRKISDKGFVLTTFMRLQKYIGRCREGKEDMEPQGIIRALLPTAYKRSLIWNAFTYAAPALPYP